MEEEWHKIDGFDNYSISNYGEVMNDYTGHFLKPCVKKGYYYITLSKNNNATFKLLHRIIAETFVPNPNNLPQINHKNQIRKDNRIDNLEWCTNIENSQSKNKTCQIGCVSSYTIKEKTYYKAKITIYGKTYQYNNKYQDKCEDWLNGRRIEVKNGQKININNY